MKFAKLTPGDANLLILSAQAVQAAQNQLAATTLAQVSCINLIEKSYNAKYDKSSGKFVIVEEEEKKDG